MPVRLRPPPVRQARTTVSAVFIEALNKAIRSAEIGREGRQYYAFYKGYQAQRSDDRTNPYAPGSREHVAWQRGWQYGAEEGRP